MFAAARALGGYGVLIGPRAFDGSATAADLALPNVAALLAYLRGEVAGADLAGEGQ